MSKIGSDEFDARFLNQLMRHLHQAYENKDELLRKEFDRSLPFQDGFFDRWERAKRLGFADGASIYNSSLVFGDLSVGKDTWIGPYTILDASGGKITIGETCSVSAGVHIYTHDTVLWAISGGEKNHKFGSVTIGDCNYIGSQSIINLGSKIGSHCVIAANSFVNGNIDDFSIVGGTPAKKIGKVLMQGSKINLIYD